MHQSDGTLVPAQVSAAVRRGTRSRSKVSRVGENRAGVHVQQVQHPHAFSQRVRSVLAQSRLGKRANLREGHSRVNGRELSKDILSGRGTARRMLSLRTVRGIDVVVLQQRRGRSGSGRGEHHRARGGGGDSIDARRGGESIGRVGSRVRALLFEGHTRRIVRERARRTIQERQRGDQSIPTIVDAGLWIVRKIRPSTPSAVPAGFAARIGRPGIAGGGGESHL
mmetsp:Transcript_21578/g.63287  ORF Transcript_21578/g.63287 Transcript_21578/m.63287 type:complete len:224 (-) Transcript_21578:4539-5210(-)